METNVFTTRQLIALIPDLVVPRTFLLDRFFGTSQVFDTEVIDFDIVTKGRKLAPFVSPVVAGKPMKLRGSTTKTFKPAYIKPKTAIKPGQALKRRPGERMAGELSPQARHDAIVMDVFEDHLEAIKRRKEWMAAQVLDTGALVIEGEDFPKAEIDYGRHADLTIALTGGDRWGQAGVKVVDTIETWAQKIQDHGGGAARDVIMDPKAWKVARLDEDFLKLLDNRRQASGNVELGPISQPLDSARYVGNVGDFDFWVYQEVYENDAGVATKLLADFTVLMGSTALEGVQAHGAILDPKAGYVALEAFPKNWIDDDPAMEFAMTQSAPLIVPGRPNASLRARVQ